jgi:hypothetical protein
MTSNVPCRIILPFLTQLWKASKTSISNDSLIAFARFSELIMGLEEPGLHRARLK